MGGIWAATTSCTYPGETATANFGGYTFGQPFPTYTVFKAFHDYFSVTSAGVRRGRITPSGGDYR